MSLAANRWPTRSRAASTARVVDLDDGEGVGRGPQRRREVLRGPPADGRGNGSATSPCRSSAGVGWASVRAGAGSCPALAGAGRMSPLGACGRRGAAGSPRRPPSRRNARHEPGPARAVFAVQVGRFVRGRRRRPRRAARRWGPCRPRRPRSAGAHRRTRRGSRSRPCRSTPRAAARRPRLVALGLQPPRHGSLGDRLPELRHRDAWHGCLQTAVGPA